MAAPAELDRDTAYGVAACLVPAPLETFTCFLRFSMDAQCRLRALGCYLAGVSHPRAIDRDIYASV